MNREKEGTRKTEDEGRPGSLPLKTLSRMGGGGRESIKRYLAFLNGTWPIEWHFEGVREGGRGARLEQVEGNETGRESVTLEPRATVVSKARGLGGHPFSTPPPSLQFLSSWLLFRVLVIAWSGSSLSK